MASENNRINYQPYYGCNNGYLDNSNLYTPARISNYPMMRFDNIQSNSTPEFNYNSYPYHALTPANISSGYSSANSSFGSPMYSNILSTNNQLQNQIPFAYQSNNYQQVNIFH